MRWGVARDVFHPSLLHIRIEGGKVRHFTQIGSTVNGEHTAEYASGFGISPVACVSRRESYAPCAGKAVQACRRGCLS